MMFEKSMPKKKTIKKKIAKKKTIKKKKPAVGKKAGAQKSIGRVTHFFGNLGVAIVKFKKPVSAGATVHFKGATTDFKAAISSMQYNHKPIARAPKNKEIGIKVKERVREGDEVFEVR